MKPSVSFVYNGEPRTHTFSSRLTKLRVDDTLTVTAELRPSEEYSALEWVLRLENPGTTESGRISGLFDCDMLLPLTMDPAPRPGYLPGKEGPWVTAMKGMVSGPLYAENDPVSATEFALEKEYLWPDVPRKYANRGGRSSDGRAPFFDIQALGAGAVVAIGWTGGWKAEFTREEKGVRIRTGLQNLDLCLRPGESIRTSSVLIMTYTSSEDGPNKFRRLIRERYSHTTGHSDARPGILAAELWGGLTGEEMCKRLREYKKYGVQFEDAWIDAGWYGDCTKCDDCYTGDWFLHTGDWKANRRVHPGKLEDVRDAAADNNMRIMLWYECERAVDSVPVRKEHPDWFLNIVHPDGKRDTSCILYYGNPEALEYQYKLLSSDIRRLNMSVLRQDFNVDLDEFFAQNDAPGRSGITEIRHITGMYDLWDRLLKEFPGLIIDNCASGGRRIDIETLRRSIPFFRSDYQCGFNPTPEVMQTHNSNVARYLPGTGCTTKAKADTYALRSAYSTSFGMACYQAIFQSMSEEDFRWQANLVAEYRRIRWAMNRDFYNLGSSVYDMTGWAVWQYHDPDSGRGILLAFRRPESPFDRADFDLNGIPENARLSLQLTADDFSLCKPGRVGKYRAGKTAPSAEWAEGRLTVFLPEKRSSLLIEYGIR